jgi:para-nitrobenzyl esterase
MLRLNIWTPSLTGRRPVMFYIHGGGYSFGSSYELASHECAQMARHHDVVQVSINHRLNILGFFDVSEIGGAAYEDSVNVGMTDLTAALRWVHDNIENFGGDPDRVMIYGQSGGGSKVTTLMGMPSAVGLFHRASVQSGGGGNIPDKEQQREVSRMVMKDLGLAPNDIGSLQKTEWAKLNAAGDAMACRVRGTQPSFSSALTTPIAAGREPGIHPKHKPWQRKWLVRGRPLRRPEIRIYRTCIGRRAIPKVTKPWFGITSAIWPMIPIRKHAASS